MKLETIGNLCSAGAAFVAAGFWFAIAAGISVLLFGFAVIASW
jgi:hypothetical protein